MKVDAGISAALRVQATGEPCWAPCLMKQLLIYKTMKYDLIDPQANADFSVEESNPCDSATDDSKMDSLISVVVPAYNVEKYIEECLKSILDQSGINLEIIIVNDGSTDRTGAIIDLFAKQDARIHVVHQGNRGPGEARNVGVRMATGEYLSFVDPDDYLLPAAYETMLKSITGNNADFVTANVIRLKNEKFFPSALHGRVITNDRENVTIREYPNFIWDTVVWNKLYRMDFYRTKVGEFEDMLYEDMLPMCKAHVAATNVNVLSQPVYVWRARDDNSSITQDRMSVDKLLHRLKANSDIWEHLHEHAPSLLRDFEFKQLSNDFFLYFPSIPLAEEKFRDIFFGHLRTFISRFSAESFSDLGLPQKMVYALLERGRIYDIASLLPYCGKNSKQYDVVFEGGHFFAELPFRKDWNALPGELYLLTDNLHVDVCATGVSITRQGCRVDVRLCMEGFTASDVANYEIDAQIVDQDNQRQHSLYINDLRFAKAKNTELNGSELLFSIDVDFVQLSQRKAGKRRADRLMLDVGLGYLQRRIELEFDPSLEPQWPARHFNDWAVRPEVVENVLHISLIPIKVLLLGFKEESGTLHLFLKIKPALKPVSIALLYPYTGVHIADVPVREEAGVHTCTIPLAKLMEYGDCMGHNISVGLDEDNGRRHRIWCASHLMLPSIIDVPRGLTEVCFSPAGSFNLKVWRDVIRIDSASLQEGLLSIEGSFHGVFKNDRVSLVLTNVETKAEFELFSQVSGQAFEINFNLAHVERAPECFAPLPVGAYNLSFSKYTADQSMVIDAVSFERGEQSIFGGLEYELKKAKKIIKLTVRNRLGDEERGPENQERLQQVTYSAARKSATKPLVIFDSWNGKKIDDNPLAIYRELKARHQDIDLRFAIVDSSVPVPRGANVVRKWSEEYWRMLGAARLIVFNDRLPNAYTPRSDQYVLQTWHGTPIKKIGHDIADPKFDKNYLVSLELEVPKWNMLISPNSASTGRFRSAFKFDGEVLETGYPRNDVLLAPDRDKIRDHVRASLGIRPDEFCIFYAPTWRDGKKIAPGKYGIDIIPDLELVQKSIPKSRIIFRAHHLMVSDIGELRNKRIQDVSSYPDVALLYLAADVLISDYSSVIVDYSVTGKPMLFYTPDLSEYSDQVRGFYGDFTAEAPGPFLYSQEELIAALVEAKSGVLASRYAEHYKQWQLKYCYLDDGQASKRVVSRIGSLVL